MSSTSELLSIGELGRRVGATPSALRYWERAGLLDAATRITALEATASLLEHTLACPEPSLAQCSTFRSFVSWRATGG